MPKPHFTRLLDLPTLSGLSGLPHVVMTCVETDTGFLAQGEDLLQPQEIERADRFRVPLARQTFVMGRYLARMGLAALTGCRATEIQFNMSEKGKPVLATSPMDFSISHSGRWVAVAFHSASIGCDIELGPNLKTKHFAGVARTVFAPDEMAALYNAPAGSTNQRDRMLSIWRRKEAVLKATGLGFSGLPQSFSVVTESGAFCDRINLCGATFALAEVAKNGRPPIALAWITASCETLKPEQATPR